MRAHVCMYYVCGLDYGEFQKMPDLPCRWQKLCEGLPLMRFISIYSSVVYPLSGPFIGTLTWR